MNIIGPVLSEKTIRTAGQEAPAPIFTAPPEISRTTLPPSGASCSPERGRAGRSPSSGESRRGTTWRNGSGIPHRLANGDYAIGLFNKGDQDGHIRCLLNDAGLSAGSGYGFRLRILAWAARHMFSEKSWPQMEQPC